MPTTSDGLSERLERIERLLSNADGDRPPHPTLFADLAETAIAAARSPKTARDMRTRLRALPEAWAGRYAHEITRADVGRFLNAERDRGLSAASLNAIRSYLSTTFRVGVDLGHVLESPVRGFRRERADSRDFVYIDPDRQRILADSMPSPLVRSMVLILLDTGLRISEFAALRIADVDTRERKLRVASGGSGLRGKTKGARRTVPLTDRALAELAFLIDHAKRKGRDTVSPYAAHSGHAGRLFLEGRKRAGLDEELPARWHSLRHLCACNLLRGGLPVQDVARMLGISTRMIVEVYGRHAREDFDDAARDALNRINGND